MGLTYNPQNSVTSAIVLRAPDRSEGPGGSLVSFLRERLDLANHPSFPLHLLAYQEVRSFEGEFDSILDELVDIEQDMGHTATFSSWKARRNSQDLDLLSTTKALNRLASDLASATARGQRILPVYEKIQVFESKVQLGRSPKDDPRWDMQAQELRQFAECEVAALKYSLVRCEKFTKDVQIQLAVVSRTRSFPRQLKL